MRKGIGIILLGSLSLMLVLGGCDIKFGVGELTVGNIVFNDMELSSGVGSVNFSLHKYDIVNVY